MEIVSKKNFLILLSAILIVALPIMAMTLSKRQTKQPVPKDNYEQEIRSIQSQSTSDNLVEIERDLSNTDFSQIDKELQDIENELNSGKDLENESNPR